MKNSHVYSLSTVRTEKGDVDLVAHDIKANLNPTQGSSIKSIFAKQSSLLNPSPAINFIYKIKPPEKLRIEDINNLTTTPKIGNRIKEIENNGCELKFHSIAENVTSLNLQLIDADLPEILSQLLIKKYKDGISNLSEALDELKADNPLGYDLSFGHPFYEQKIKDFLTDCALGMTPTAPWTGHYDATGGVIIVKEDGDIVCYHIYNRNEFQDYLLNNTKLEQASTERHQFGDLYEENGSVFLKLNLQIRFVQ